MSQAKEGKFSLNIEEPNIPATISIPNYPSHSLPPAPSSLSDTPVLKIQKYLKVLKWSLIPLFLIQFFFIIPKAYPLLLNLPFPILGLLGTIKLSPYLLKLFGIYLITLSACLLISVILLKGTAYIILQTFSILFELFLSYLSLKSGIFIESLSDHDFNLLKPT